MAALAVAAATVVAAPLGAATGPAAASGATTALSTTARATASAPTSRQLPGTNCRVFPPSSVFHADVSRLPVHPRSRTWMRNMQAGSRDLHPDFGPSYGEQPVPYGIPVTVVGGAHAKVRVRFDYASESDRRRYPLGSDTRIEGGRGADGDRHAIIVDRSTCRLYETWNTRKRASGWTAGSGASWDLRSNALRPAGWTSADAAGLPILAGLLRYDEVKAGRVDHPIRFTTNVTSTRYVWPARHQAGSTSSRDYPPMGAWFRLKAGYDLSGYGRDARVVLRGMKRHGLILADNGSPWYFQGTADKRWTGRLVEQLKRVPASAFEAIDVSSLRVTGGSARTR